MRCLGQEQPALDRTQEGESQFPRIGRGCKLAALLHPGEPLFYGVPPHRKAAGETLSRWLGLVGQLACQRPQRAASAPGCPIEPDDGVAPRRQRGQRVQRPQVRLLGVENALGLSRDHLQHQRVLVCEVVIELRLAHAACGHHLVQARPVRAVFVEQIGGGVDDARPRRRSASGQGTGCGVLACRHAGTVTLIGLDSPVSSRAMWTDQSSLTESTMTRLQNGQAFPVLDVAAVGGGTFSIPQALLGSYGVVLIYRGAWCPYCQAQLGGFERAREKLAEAGIKVVALSVDDEATTVGTIEKFKLTFPVGHSADADQVAAITGAYTNEDPHYLQATGFLLAPDGAILNAVYSSGPLGRLVAEDVIGMVAYL